MSNRREVLKSIQTGRFLRGLIAAQSFDDLTGLQLLPPNPYVCFVDSEEDDKEEEKPTAGKTYTDDEVQKIVKTRLKKQERELETTKKALEAAQKKHAETDTRLKELEDKLETSGKTDHEKELAKVQREHAKALEDLKRFQTERDEAVKIAAEASSGLTRTKLETTLREALRTHKAHGKGMDQAVRLMLSEGATYDEEGAFAMKVGEVPYDKPDDAAKKWLEANPHFVEGAGGGSGTPRAGNGKLITGQQMEAMSTTSLLAAGLKTTPPAGSSAGG